MLTLTPAAAAKVGEFLTAAAEAEPDAQVHLRVAVQAGGCAGMSYALLVDDRVLDGDVVVDAAGSTVRVDAASAALLDGAVLDWIESLQASGFRFDNPNAGRGCACGESFSGC